MGHPCLTLRPITPGSESPPTVGTTASCLMYRSCNNLLSLQSVCKLFSISNSVPSKLHGRAAAHGSQICAHEKTDAAHENVKLLFNIFLNRIIETLNL